VTVNFRDAWGHSHVPARAQNPAATLNFLASAIRTSDLCCSFRVDLRNTQLELDLAADGGRSIRAKLQIRHLGQRLAHQESVAETAASSIETALVSYQHVGIFLLESRQEKEGRTEVRGRCTIPLARTHTHTHTHMHACGCDAANLTDSRPGRLRPSPLAGVGPGQRSTALSPPL
jgi:hypothetical protein